MFRVSLPDAGKEIIKSPDAGSIPERETAEDGIKRSFPEHAAPDRDGSYLQLQRKQIGAQHAGREPGFRAKNGVTLLHISRYAAIISLPLQPLALPDFLQKAKMAFLKAISWPLCSGALSTPLADTFTGWITCRKTSRSR